MIRATARRATEADLDFILATERLPGYEKTVGRFEEAQHRLNLASPEWIYLVSEGCGLAILQDVENPNGNVQLRRFIVTETGSGLGSALLPVILGYTFQNTTAHRIWLRVVAGNDAALRLYEKCGFSREGVEREAGRRPDDIRFDFITMSILKSEWDARS